MNNDPSPFTSATEIDSLDTEAKVRYSVCTLVKRHDEYREMLDTFRDAGFSQDNSEFLYIDNSSFNKYDGYTGINRFLHVARGEYVILCHQDVRLHYDRLVQLDQRIGEVTRLDPGWAVLGNAGGVAPGHLAIRITDPHGKDTREGQFPARVVSLDENFMVVRRAANMSVSADLTGFHFYGTDLCILAGILGYRCYVIDFHLWHVSGESQPGKPNSQVFKSDYPHSRARLIEKYRRAFAPRWMQNTGTTFFLSGFRFLNFVVDRNIIRSLVRKYYRLFG